MGFGIKELVIILVIILLLFGTKKLKNIGGDLGGAIKGFRKSMTDDDEDASASAEKASLEKKEGDTITGEATTVSDNASDNKDKQA